MLRGQGTVTDREQALLERARGGDFAMTIPELKALMGVFSRMNRAQYQRHMSSIERARKLPGAEEAGLDYFMPEAFPDQGGTALPPAPANVPQRQPVRPQAPKAAPGAAIDFNQLK
jgi:hypothetical protein